MTDTKRDQLSRRGLLKIGAAAVAGAVMLPILGMKSASAATKASKKAMQYQDKPKDGKKCENCTQYIPADSKGAQGKCKVVEGDISPEGWCIAFAPKSS